QAFGDVDLVAVDQRAAIGDHQRELAAHDPADVDLVADQLRVRPHLAAELHLPHAQRAPAPGLAQPGQVEACELPHRVHAQAAGHHRVALEMAGEEPQVGSDVELCADQALAERAALAGDLRDAVEHQHRRQRQARVAGAEHFAAAAGKALVAIQRRRRSHRSVQVRERSNYVSSAVKPRRRTAAARPRAGRKLTRIKHVRDTSFTIAADGPGVLDPGHGEAGANALPYAYGWFD